MRFIGQLFPILYNSWPPSLTDSISKKTLGLSLDPENVISFLRTHYDFYFRALITLNNKPNIQIYFGRKDKPKFISHLRDFCFIIINSSYDDRFLPIVSIMKSLYQKLFEGFDERMDINSGESDKRQSLVGQHDDVGQHDYDTFDDLKEGEVADLQEGVEEGLWNEILRSKK